MSAWGGGNPGGGSNFGGSNQSPFNPDSAMMGQTNPAAAGVGGSTGGGGGTLSVPQTPFAGGMQRPMGDAQQPQGPPQMGNWGNRPPQSMARPMGMGGGMQGPPQGYPAMQRPSIQGGMGQPMQQPMGMQRPGMQQGMGQPMPPQQNGMPMPPSSILARMRSGGQGGPPSSGGPQPGMSNTRLAPPPQGPPMGPPQAPPQVMQPDQLPPQAAPPPMQGQPTDNQDVNSMLRNSNNALAPAALGAQSYGR